MKTSARKLIEGTIEEVQTDGVMGVIKIEIDSPAVVTSVITNESVNDLDLKKATKLRS